MTRQPTRKHPDLRARLREAYNRKARERDSRTPEAWKVEERASFLSLLQQEQKRTLLKIGAGTGRNGKFFQDQGLDVVCTDLSPENVRLCRQKGLNAYIADFADLPFPAESFDAVYALNCLLHAPTSELCDVLKGIDSVLKPNGLFYMGVYGRRDQEGIFEEDTYEPKRFFSYRSDEHLVELVEGVFDVHSFKQIPLGDADSRFHFQSVILRKKHTPNTVSYQNLPTALKPMRDVPVRPRSRTLCH